MLELIILLATSVVQYAAKWLRFSDLEWSFALHGGVTSEDDQIFQTWLFTPHTPLQPSLGICLLARISKHEDG